MTLKRGQTLQQGRYRIEKRLGQGGMATVYLAVDHRFNGRLVAIKENSDTVTETQAQFRREAMMLTHLAHPHLPRFLDHFIEASGRQYLVMDYIEGENLREIVQRRGAPLAEADAIAWLQQVMDALEYMHTLSVAYGGYTTPIIHRDIKPGNIKCTPTGHIVLVDFGLAKYQVEQGTLTGARAISPGYSPLEQYTGGTDIRSDVYALGATFYTLLTGQQPPEAPAIATGTPLQPPRKLNPAISRNTERIILRAMQLQPADRYGSIQEMRAALNRQTRSITLFSIYQGWRPRTTKGLRWDWLAGALLALLLLATVALAWNTSGRAPGQGTFSGLSEVTRLATVPTSVTIGENVTTIDTTTITREVSPTPMKDQVIGEAALPSAETPAPPPLSFDVPTSTPSTTLEAIALQTVTPTGAPTISPTDMATEKGADVAITNQNVTPTPIMVPTRQATSTLIPFRLPDTVTPVPIRQAATPNLATVASNEILPPVLVLPADGASLAARKIIFQWRWEGELQTNWGFEVRGWRNDQSHNGLHDARETIGIRPDANGIYSLLVSVPYYLDNASWRWSVAVVELDPYNRIGPEGESRNIYYQPPSPLR
ncbi:MAG: serine/threonine-protein kinase [Caldilineaceae bacterium]